jgi:hypothetical protein
MAIDEVMVYSVILPSNRFVAGMSRHFRARVTFVPAGSVAEKSVLLDLGDSLWIGVTRYGIVGWALHVGGRFSVRVVEYKPREVEHGHGAQGRGAVDDQMAVELKSLVEKEIDIKKFDGIQTANTHTTKALQAFFDDDGPGPYMWPAEQHGFISMLHYVHALAADRSSHMYSYSETGPGNLKQYTSLSLEERAEHIGTCHANYVLYLAETGRQRSDMSTEAALDELAQSGTWAALHMLKPEGDELEELEEPSDAANSDLSLEAMRWLGRAPADEVNLKRKERAGGGGGEAHGGSGDEEEDEEEGDNGDEAGMLDSMAWHGMA